MSYASLADEKYNALIFLCDPLSCKHFMFLPRIGFLSCLRDKLITPVSKTLFVIVLGVCF